MKDIVAKHHLRLLSLWDEHSSSGLPGFDRVPYFGQLPVSARGSQLLFIGMNPSYVEGALGDLWKGAHEHNPVLTLLGAQALEWKNFPQGHNRLERVDVIETFDIYCREKYERFYGPIRDLAIDAGVESDWQHLDLFPVRATSQSSLLPHVGLGKDKSLACAHPYRELLEASFTLIAAMMPSVVLVANAAASRLLAEKLSLRRQVNGHRYDCPSLPDVTFLLSTQLSGGATSKFARERLLADLRDALEGGSGLPAPKASSRPHK